jgi:hypothetical protein
LSVYTHRALRRQPRCSLRSSGEVERSDGGWGVMGDEDGDEDEDGGEVVGAEVGRGGGERMGGLRPRRRSLVCMIIIYVTVMRA